MAGKKTTITAIVIIVLLIGMYFAYESDENLIKRGRYALATITKTQYARGGIRVWSTFSYRGVNYKVDGIHPIPELTIDDVGKRFFILFSPESPGSHSRLTNYMAPDSMQYVPSEGWSEAWMQEHFPKVVEYVHDTR